jgi:hypothetical protein
LVVHRLIGVEQFSRCFGALRGHDAAPTCC